MRALALWLSLPCASYMYVLPALQFVASLCADDKRSVSLCAKTEACYADRGDRLVRAEGYIHPPPAPLSPAQLELLG